MNGTGEIRNGAKKNLHAAALRVVDEKLAYIKGKGRTPHSRSLAFRDWLLSLPEARGFFHPSPLGEGPGMSA
jgi:HD superfamily phosphohydrolase YqeK